MLKELKAWLKKPGNSTLILAINLHYNSQSTIHNWIKRKKIPDHVKPRLKELLK